MGDAPIPQCNPSAGYHELASRIDAAVARVLTGGRYVLGPEVSAFESEFAQWLAPSDTGSVVGVASGTDAIELALRAAGVGPGDAVVTVSMSAVATATAIRAAGADPLFADVDDERGLMDPDSVRDVLARTSARVRAIVPVHLYGHCVDMDAIGHIASGAGLTVIEDCAQAHGATWRGRQAGTIGAAGCFSFYPTKNLGAIGDGGAIYSGDAAIVERVRLLRQYGWRERYVSDVEGGNSRLDELQAAILRVKLGVLHADNARRGALARLYRAALAHPDVRVPSIDDAAAHVHHQFVVRTPRRDALQAYLAARGVSTLVHYPRAIHQQPAYADPSYRPVPLPRTEAWAAEVLSLPMFPQLAPDDAARVARAVTGWDGTA